MTPYAIHHTFATDAIIRGVDLATVAELMGHTNLRMLSEIYQHVGKRRDRLKKGLRKATGHLKRAGDGRNGVGEPPSPPPPAE